LYNLKIRYTFDQSNYSTVEELTKTEEKVMRIFWRINRGFVKDIIDLLDEDPKPPYTTISSVVRILESKGYLGYQAYGKTHEYFPLISKEDYRKHRFQGLVSYYFDGKIGNLLSFMTQEKKLSGEELDALREWINRQNS
jgi:BlaI family transcriptional regulator, penicillinase repressor